MWELIVTGISSFIVSGGLTTLVCLKTIKKKAANEVDSVAVETMKDAISEIRQSNDHLIEINEQLADKISEQNEKISELEKDLTLGESLICKKMCCKKREPISGLGNGFIKCLKEGKCQLDYSEVE